MPEPRRFRNKKPATIEAVQFNGLDDYLRIVDWMKSCKDTSALADEIRYSTPIMFLHTWQGTMAASPGDWIVRGDQGEFYPIKGPIFREIYDPAD